MADVLEAEPILTKRPLPKWFLPVQRYLILVASVFLLPTTAFAILGMIGGGSVWWLDLFNHFWVQYMLVFMVTAMMLAFALSRKLFVLSLIMIGLGVWKIGPLYWDTNYGAFGEVLEIKILHFNVNTTSGDTEAVAKYIAGQDADLVFLQEVSMEWLDALEGNIGEYELVVAEPRSDNFGIACYERTEGKRIKLIEPRVVDRSNGFVGVPAIELTAELESGETPTLVPIMSLHTLPPTSGENALKRDSQLKMAGIWARDQGHRAVIVGDLNTTPWSASMREMLKDANLLNSQAGQGIGTTWPASLPPLMGIPIDHCLHGGSISVIDRQIGESCGSDHRSLHLTLRVAADVKIKPVE